MRTPLIPLIIPMCSVEKYIEKCLSGATGQVYKSIKIIVMDDNLTDRSADIDRCLMKR